MSGFFKNIFAKKKAPRVIQTPADLQIGDIVQFKNDYGLPNDLRAQTFEILKIHTYEFEHEQITEFLVQGTGESFYLSLEEDNDQSFLAIGKRIANAQVGEIFDLDAFGQQFDAEVFSPLAVQHKPNPLTDYLADEYLLEVQAKRGFYHAGDYRQQAHIEADGEAFDYYFFTGNDGSFAIDATVYSTGETEVSAILYRPLSVIESMWPKADTGEKE